MTVLTVGERDRLFGIRCNVRKVTVRNPWGDRVVLHELIAPVYLEACAAADADPFTTWRPARTDSYACRTVRGSKTPSLHSWALAVDKFATAEQVPPPGGVWTPDDPMPPEFARHFIRRGFRWGAFFRRRDLPHLEWPEEPPGPRSSSPIAPKEAVMALNRPACAILATPTGHGYLIVAEDGGVFAFGDAPFHGSTGGLTVAAPVRDLAARPAGDGYWMVAEDGGVFSFGAGAHWWGAIPSLGLCRWATAAAIDARWTGEGYVIAATDGTVHALGDAAHRGDGPGSSLRIAPVDIVSVGGPTS